MSVEHLNGLTVVSFPLDFMGLAFPFLKRFPFVFGFAPKDRKPPKGSPLEELEDEVLQLCRSLSAYK